MPKYPSRRDFVSTSTSTLAALAAIPMLPRGARAELARREASVIAHPFDLRRVRLLPGVFRDDVDVNRRFLMGLDPDRLLVSFRATAGLPTTAEPYHGWEAPNNELRGHFVGHYLSGCALMAAQLGDDAVKSRGDFMVGELARCQQASGYLSAFPTELFDRLKAHRGVWAPFYTYHKIFAGMLDQYTLSGNAQALDVARRMAGWTRDWVGPLDDTQMQIVLRTEFGGMGESLNNLAAITGDMSWIDVSRRFDHERILAPLAAGRDELTRVHANTTIPKIIAAARRYEITGDQRSHDIANYFWREVTGKRCFVTGGTSSGESWKNPVGALSGELAPDTEESCPTYNMLKLTRQVFGWTAEAGAADYYERALFNGMLGTQHPVDGEKIYYTPLASGYWRMFGAPEHGFWCCHGTGVESHSKFGDSIYFHDDKGIWVNQFIASELHWTEHGVRVVQTTSFPQEPETHLTVHVARPTMLALRLRVPYWATQGAAVKVNGRSVRIAATPSSYAVIERNWKDGDQVVFSMPMSLHIHAMPDDPTLQAV
ncbi:MAG: glycoside hydrolase family 127 protein, partial [Gemmatimonadales bacterium]